MTYADKSQFVKTLFKRTLFLLLQELWLYESDKILILGKHCELIATTAMNDSCHKIGRKFGGTAIVLPSSIKGTITKLDSIINEYAV